ncbi:MAG: chaperone modulatory protein CbpM [Francisellaceae bacterium]|jgi:chaperone modulatory protein CbpM
MSIIIEYSTIEICQTCMIKTEIIIEMVEEIIIEPLGDEPEDWRFNESDLFTIKKAIRLHNDLGINFAGIALALDLYGQVEKHQSRISHLENLLIQFEK